MGIGLIWNSNRSRVAGDWGCASGVYPEPAILSCSLVGWIFTAVAMTINCHRATAVVDTILPAEMQARLPHPLSPNQLGIVLSLAAGVATSAVVTAEIRSGLRA